MNTEKLTLQNIAPYLPYGLKIDTSYYDNEGYSTVVGFNHTDLIVWDGQWASTYGKKIEQDYYIGHVKPVLRPMDLTKPIIVEGKEIIPIVELAKIGVDDFPHGNHVIDSNEQSQLLHLNNGTVFGYDRNGFYFKECRKPLHVSNQLTLFKWLYANKFDVDGLIEKGLAIDSTTLNINPYNS